MPIVFAQTYLFRERAMGKELSFFLIVFLVISTIQLAQSVSAQEKFESIPKNIAPQYRFDLARNFFASPEAEKVERRKFY